MANAWTHVLIGLLVACLAAGQPVGKNDDDSSELSEFDRALVEKGLYAYDDDMNLIRVGIRADDDQETEEATKADLANRVIVYLFTRSNPKNGQQLKPNDAAALRNSNFNAKRPTRIVTHGWLSSSRNPACTDIRDAYLKNGDYNVIVVDWSKISFRTYRWASKRVKMVGQYVAKMIDFLEKQGMKLDTTIMAGHSLGAHVVGLAGYYAKGRVNYIVGLDPALPFFSDVGAGSRISRMDARHVEIIHTNSGLLGHSRDIGHADFYPNGGTKQPGCIVDIGGACSHSRVTQLFAESINSNVGFYGKSCNSYGDFKAGKCNRRESSLMGGCNKALTASGSYYLDTNTKEPYAMGRV